MTQSAAVFRPFVLKCPNCVAPVEDGQTECAYCSVALKWEAVVPIDRDDFRFQKVSIVPNTSNEEEDIVTFPMTVVPGNCTVRLSAQPVLPYKAHRIFIPKMYAVNFAVTGFYVGKDLQFVANFGKIPAITFSEEEVNPRLNCDICLPGQNLTLEVENLTACAWNISAILKGKIIKDLHDSKRYGRF